MALEVSRQIRNPVVFLAAVVVWTHMLALDSAQSAVGVYLLGGKRGSTYISDIDGVSVEFEVRISQICGVFVRIF